MTELITREKFFSDEEILKVADLTLAEAKKNPDFYENELKPFAQLIEEKFLKTTRDYKIFHVFVGSDLSEGKLNQDFSGEYSIFKYLSLESKQRQKLLQKLWQSSLRDLKEKMYDELEKITDVDEMVSRLDLIENFKVLVLEAFSDCRSYRIFHLLAGSTISNSYEKEIQHEEDFPGDYSVENFFKIDWDDKRVLVAELKKQQKERDKKIKPYYEIIKHLAAKYNKELVELISNSQSENIKEIIGNKNGFSEKLKTEFKNAAQEKGLDTQFFYANEKSLKIHSNPFEEIVLQIILKSQ